MRVMLKPRCNRRSGWEKRSPRPKKKKKSTDVLVKDQGDAGSVSFFNWKGIVHQEFVPRGQLVNKQLCQEILERLRNAVRRKRPELWENQTWILHHDNAPADATLIIRSYLAKHQTSVVPHPPYSPDLAPADIFLFSKRKNRFQGTSYPNRGGN